MVGEVLSLPDLEGGNIMWQVLIPYLHQQLVFGGFVLEPWQWFSWWPYLSAFGR